MQKNQVAYIGLNNLFGRIVTSLLKQSPNISKLVLYDDKNGGTVQSYTNGPDEESNVTTIYGRERLPSALTKADIVVIGDELFQTPSPDSIKSIGYKAAEYARLIATFSPNAILVIAAYPLNYVLPIFARVLEAAGCFDPRRLLGATSCDTLRASTLLSSRLRLSPQKTILPVIGGASSKTRIPLFSQANSPIEIDQDTKLDVVDKLKLFDGTEYSEADVIERAYASVRFTHSVLAARRGFNPIPEIALTRNEEIPNVEYFSMPLLIGKDGVEKIMKLPKLSPFESNMLQSAIECLNADISASKKLMNDKNALNDVQDLGVQFRLIEDNEDQISKKHYDIQNQVQDKCKDFVELDSVLTGVSDTVRQDVYADSIKNEENVKINLPSMEEIHRVTTTFVMPHDRHSTKLHAQTPVVTSQNMEEKAEDIDLMINNILPKNNGLPFNKVTLSQVKNDIGCTKTEVYPDTNLTYRRRGLTKFSSKENKSSKKFMFKPTPPKKRVYGYLKKSKKNKEPNFLADKSIIEEEVNKLKEVPFLKEASRKLPLPVKLKINKTGAKLAESELSEGKPLISFNVPIQEDQNDELGYPSGVLKLSAENPDTYLDSTTEEKSLIPFQDKNETNTITVDTSTIESDFEKLQKDYDQFDIKAPEVVENANKQMLKNQGIIDEKLTTSQDPEDRLNVLEVRDMAKRFEKLEQAIQQVLSMNQKPASIEATNNENLSVAENKTLNTPQIGQTTKNLVLPQDRKILNIPEQYNQNVTVQQESSLNTENKMESQFVTSFDVPVENTIEEKVPNQFGTIQELPETKVVHKQRFTPIQHIKVKEESSEIQEKEVNIQNSSQIPEIELHKTEKLIINENKIQPLKKVVNLAKVQPKTDQLQESTDSKFSQFETTLDQIIEESPKSLVNTEEAKAQPVLNIKEKTIIKLQKPIKMSKPEIEKFNFFKELHERFEFEKKRNVNSIDSKINSIIPEYVQNMSEHKSDFKSSNLINELNENLKKNEEDPDSFLLFKKAFDHVLSTAPKSSVNLEEISKEKLNTVPSTSVNLEELQNKAPILNETVKRKLSKSLTSENIEKEIISLVHQLKKNKDVTESDKILRKIYSELSDDIKTKKSSSISDEKFIKKIDLSILPKKDTFQVKSNKIDLKGSEILDNKEKINLGLKTLIINIKKNNLEVANRRESDKIKDGKIKIILTPKSKIKEKPKKEDEAILESRDKKENIEVKSGIISLTSDVQPKEPVLKDVAKLVITKIPDKKENIVVKSGIINLKSDVQPEEPVLKDVAKLVISEIPDKKENIVVKSGIINLKSDVQPEEPVLKDVTKLVISEIRDKKENIVVKSGIINLKSDVQPEPVLKDVAKLGISEIPSTTKVQPNAESCINPLGPWCKETTALNLNIPLNEFKIVKTDIKIKEESLKKPDEVRKEILLAINPSVVPFVTDSPKIIKQGEIAETSSKIMKYKKTSLKTKKLRTESLKTKIAKHRKRRRPKVVALLRGRNNDEKFKIVRLEVKRNRLKSKTTLKPNKVKTGELKVVEVIKVQTPKTELITKASEKLAEARSNKRHNIENEHNKKIERSLRARQSMRYKELEDSFTLKRDNPVNKFLAKAMAKKKLNEATFHIKANPRRKRKPVEVKDSIKPYGFSLPSEKKSGHSKSEKIIADKKNSLFKKNVINVQTKTEKKENVTISLTSKIEKSENSMKKVKKIELKTNDEKNLESDKIKNDIFNFKIDPFPKNEADICLVGSDTPFPDWSPIADDYIPITGEVGPSSEIEMKNELDTQLMEEIPEIKKPIDLVITPKSQESIEPKKTTIPLNSPESKLSAMKLELESTKAAVKAHNLNVKPREKKISTKAWEAKSNFKISNKVRENLVSKTKLNEQNVMKKNLSNDAKVVKSASMLALREAHIRVRNFPSAKTSKSLASIRASLKQAVTYAESAADQKSKSNLNLDTKPGKSNTKISGVKIAPKFKRDDKITITSSEKLLKNKKYEYNIGKIKGGIKKGVVENAYKSKHIHTQTDLQGKHDDRFIKENAIKGIIDLRNKHRSESPSDNSSVADIAQKSLNESLKNAILLNAKEVTKDIFANRKLDMTKTEEKMNIKQDKKDNLVLKNKTSLPPLPVIKKPVSKNIEAEKKPKSESLSDSVSFLDKIEGKQIPKLPIILPPEPLRVPNSAELNIVPERKLKTINFEAHVQNLMKKLAHDTEIKQKHDKELQQAQDAERKQADDTKLKEIESNLKLKEKIMLKAQAENRKIETPEKNKQERHPFLNKMELVTSKETIPLKAQEESARKSEPEKNTSERNPFIKKIELINSRETIPLKPPGESTMKSDISEKNSLERNPFIKKIEPSTSKEVPIKSSSESTRKSDVQEKNTPERRPLLKKIEPSTSKEIPSKPPAESTRKSNMPEKNTPERNSFIKKIEPSTSKETIPFKTTAEITRKPSIPERHSYVKKIESITAKETITLKSPGKIRKKSNVRPPFIQKIELISSKETIPLNLPGDSKKKSNMSERITPERHPFIRKIELMNGKETIPLKAPGENTRKNNMPERNAPDRHPSVHKKEPKTPKKKPPKSPEYKAIDRKRSRAQELLNTAIEIKPSSINVHDIFPQKKTRPANSMLLPPRTPPPQMKLSPDKQETKKRNDIEYFKDFNDPHIQQMRKVYPKLNEFQFISDNSQKNKSIYQNLSHSSHEKLIAAQTPSSLKSAPHPIVPKKPVQPTKKIVATQHEESPKPIIREKRENVIPARLIIPNNVTPCETNIVAATKPEASETSSKRDGWGRLFSVFKQIISRDLEAEQVERMRNVSETTSTPNK